MAERKARADALRNRETVLAAADELFARSASPRGVSMDDIAVAAGVGKGTLFRRFGDRTGLIRAVFDARIEPLRQAVEEGPAPLGPSAAPRERVPALLDAVLCFKLDHRHLSLALEEAGSGSPYQGASYAWWHGVLRDTLEQLPEAAAGPAADSDFTAHVLLAATRADLVEHLADQEGMTPGRMRARLAAFVGRVLGDGPDGRG
ncbi:TetR/AcrR family transcriptional regulator [Streptomyces decoyicus]|uniref:TetR/AcrR family transcriptional regulator n=1 Tax=Streptomyces decoyicus TaxID=249567 RepID=UPI0004AAA203|nr:TetR/AcrR family transcriptional regulator [Streptomyces decoyicus]KOG38893.1 transcriptional regulator [Streptomyces decoyicus]QZY17292.1 TetR/AcrR family transcriptional regulator [Streptomyces decoyicus]